MFFPPYVVVACMVGIIGLTLANQTTIITLLDSWQLLPQPQRITELYFTDARHTPTVLRRDTSQKLAFTVHNIEHQTTMYDYTLIATSDDESQHQTPTIVGTGAVSLTHGQYQTINQTIRVPSIGNHITVTVWLRHGNAASNDSKEQSIDYHVKVIG